MLQITIVYYNTFGGKKFGKLIKTIESLTEKTWQIEVHLHTQEKRRVNTDRFLYHIYTIGLYTV